MQGTAEVKWGVLKIFDAFFDHIANGRLNEAMACWSGDPDIALYGSEPDDTAVGGAALRTYLAELFARPDRLLFEFPDRQISASGGVAWLTANGTVRVVPDGATSRYRVTAVFERRQGAWLWQTFSGSVQH